MEVLELKNETSKITKKKPIGEFRTGNWGKNHQTECRTTEIIQSEKNREKNISLFSGTCETIINNLVFT